MQGASSFTEETVHAQALHLQILLCPDCKPADRRVKSLQETGPHQLRLQRCMLPWLPCLVHNLNGLMQHHMGPLGAAWG